MFSSLPSTGNSCTSIPPRHQEEPPNAFAGVVAQASPSSSTVMKKGPYDVFLNHRGCDTKHTLASTIYHTLDLLGLHPFLDVEQLELGHSIPQEIEETMRTARLHIAIFSKNYAESPWCLAELCFMLTTGTLILPVFYHVNPDDLRWVAQGKGCYAEAFSQHEKKGRYSSAMLEDWKTALQKVSYLSGYMLNKPNGDEGKLLKSIVHAILRTVKKVPLEVAKHPVAMDEIVEDFERSRGQSVQGEQHVQIVGIVGFGGSGKTTLATELYNRKSCSFDRSSFLHDVRDAASKNALDTKQKKLLEDLRIQGVTNFDNSKEGKGFVADRLKGLCVLIVLDDVDHEDQLDALLPAKESLGSGSLVIITTRERDVLTKWGITSIYKIKPLQHLHAKQLFCWHAFLRPSPQQGFEDLVENCLGVCTGLPLSLKVIGGQLYGKRSRDYWVSQIEKIRKIFPKEILERLKVSYDALDEDAKEIFLDVACFFIGKRRSSAIAVWDESGWSGLCSWETLHNKCFVEVDEGDGEERIRMHDHLRDLGRQIARSHAPLRIWSHERQSMHFQPGMPVRGIIPATKRITEAVLKEYMKMMRISNGGVGSKLLEVESNEFTQDCGELSRGLLWLEWASFDHSYIPQWLSLEKIRVLSFFSCRHLEALWEDAHAPLELRELTIESAENLRSLPSSIGHLKHLKRLVVTHAKWSLSRLPEEFCRLQSLEHLDLTMCQKLSSLPNRIGDLVNLRHIDLGCCSGLNMLPLSFKQLRHLEYLDLDGCHNLTLETDIMENMTNLKVFKFSGCRYLQVLPRNITNQAYLRNLNFINTSSLRELPPSIGQLSKLEELQIEGLPLLTRLPFYLGDLSNLVTLTLRNCPELSDMPSLAGLVSLNNLHVEDCPRIKKIEGLEQLTALSKLIVRTDWMVPGIHSLGCAERLRTLTLQAENITAFGPCIESIEIEKWPCEMTICGASFPGVYSILDNFTFPVPVVVKEIVKNRCYEDECWNLIWEQTNTSNAAAIFYFFIWSRDMESIQIEGIESGEVDGIKSVEVTVSPGECILIIVLTQVPRVTDKPVVISLRADYYKDTWGVSDGGLIVGERGTVIAGFKQLFRAFRSGSHD